MGVRVKSQQQDWQCAQSPAAPEGHVALSLLQAREGIFQDTLHTTDRLVGERPGNKADFKVLIWHLAFSPQLPP